MAMNLYQPTPLPQTVADPNAQTNAQIMQNVQAQIQAQRAAQLADQLNSQSDAPIAGNGAPISAFQGLAKLLQNYNAKKQSDKADALAIQAITGSQQQEAARFNSMFPGSASPADPTASASPTSPVSALASGLGAPTAPSSLTDPTANPAPGPTDTMPSPLASPSVGVSGGAAAPGMSTPAAPPVTQVAHAAASAMPSLTGDPNQDRVLAMQMGVPKYFDAVAKRYDWTDQQKNDAAVGITAQMRKTMEIASSLKGAVVPGSTATLGMDAGGNVGASDVAGLRQNEVALTGQNTAATEANKPTVVQMGGGVTKLVYPSDVAGPAPAMRPGAPGVPPQGAAPAGGQGVVPPTTAPSAPAATGKGWDNMPKLRIPSTPGASSNTFDQKRLEGAAAAYNDLNEQYGKEADLADQRIRLGQQVAGQLQNATTGPASDAITFARGVGVQLGLLSQDQADKLASTTELNKYLIQNGLQDGKSMFGSRYTQSEVGIMLNQANASGKMSKPVIEALTTQGLIKANYEKQRAQDFQTYTDKGGDPARFQSWYATNHSLQDYTDKTYSKAHELVRNTMSASAPTAAPNVTQPVPKAPAVGTIQQGHRFMGGDPADPKSWTPVN